MRPWIARCSSLYRAVDQHGEVIDFLLIDFLLIDILLSERRRSARILAADHAFARNLRRGHYELATDVPAPHQLRAAFDQLAMTI
jgi:hypothetical protein